MHPFASRLLSHARGLVCAGLVASPLAACGDDADPAADAASAADAADTGDAGVTDADVTDDAVSACPEPDGLRPSARGEHTATYDAEHHAVFLFGGSAGVPENCSTIVDHTFENDLWRYDVACEHWARVGTVNPPTGRVRHSAVFDSARRRIVVWGGRMRTASSGDYTLLPDVVAYDIDADTWETLATNAGPSPRFNHTAVYDDVGDQMLVFGGNTSGSALNYADTDELWALDLATNTWTQLTPSGASPAPRFWGAGAWDAGRRRMFVFGGSNAANVFDPQARYMRDAWVYDVADNAWTQLDSSDGPDGRFWGAAAHDTVNDRYVVFAGHDDSELGNRNDMWAIGPDGGSWLELTAGDVYQTPANGFCDFPPDFTDVDVSVPERRHAAATAATNGGLLVAGGKSDCGLVDDMQAFDFATGAWSEWVVPTRGEVCLRGGGLNCNDLCF